jgi:hypothetical protein
VEYVLLLVTAWSVSAYSSPGKKTRPLPLLPDEEVAPTVVVVAAGAALTTSEAMFRTVRFAKDPMKLIDFFSIIPFYVELAIDGGSGLKLLRILRLLRVLRVFKFGKFNDSLEVFAVAIYNSVEALWVLAFMMSLAVIFFGSIVYFCEMGQYSFEEEAYMRPALLHQSVERTPYLSIPFSFWWVVVTMTTVGYGDIYPTTFWGKLTGVFTMLTGIVMLSFILSIVNDHFGAEMRRRQEIKQAAQVKKHAGLDAVLTEPPPDSNSTTTGGGTTHQSETARVSIL